MYRIYSASKDTYITDRIINNSFRATDANVGQAGTLDLFKLYNETNLTGSVRQTEISRILLKFDYSSIVDMQNQGKIDINDPTFECVLKLHDVYGGQTTPSNFNVIVFPLAQKFDEGVGYDISSYSDLGSTNFVTASVTNSVVSKWNRIGARASGSLGDSNIDVIVSGTLAGPAGSETISLSPVQNFPEGIEDLSVNVTKIVSGTVSGQMTNHGLLVAYSGSYEQDKRSYFVKRFASRNSANTAIRPKLIVKYDDSIQDNHQDMLFDITSSLYLNNFHYGTSANILSGAAATELTGENCLMLKIESGSFKKTFDVSQAQRGVNRIKGVYSSSFAISSFDTALRSHVLSSGSITFNEVWCTANEITTFLSSSVTISANQRFGYENKHQNLLVTVTNLKDAYKQDDVINVRVFSENRDKEVVFSKFPREKKSQIYHEMYYRVRDFNSGKIIIPFDTESKSTRLSTDSDGMYFDFYVSSLARGRLYVFDFLIKKNGFDTIVDDAASKFRVD